MLNSSFYTKEMIILTKIMKTKYSLRLQFHGFIVPWKLTNDILGIFHLKYSSFWFKLS